MLTFNSVAEIFESMAETRERLHKTLDGLDGVRENFRESPERWSIAEIVEHLSMVEGQVEKIAGKILSRAESEGAPAAQGRAPLVDLGDAAERAQKEKFQAPEFALPHGGVALADSLTRLRESRAALERLRPRIEALDLAAYRFPHPVFGPLDLYQWLVVLGLHEERHRRQIESLKTASSGEGTGSSESANAG